jgi:hypothetical protein
MYFFPDDKAKTAELRRFESACHFQREYIARSISLFEPVLVQTACGESRNRETVSKRSQAITTDLLLLNKELQQGIALNQQLREALAVEEVLPDQKTDEFRGIVAVLRADEDDEDDGVTEELQTGIIENSFRALDSYKNADWSNQNEYRRASLDLVKHFERLMCLKRLKAEKRKKLRNRITAIKQSVVTCKSALMQLLSDE